MSTIKTNAILDASGGNTTTINGTTPTAYNTMGKNLIINGDFEIAQRSSSTSTSTGYQTVDRWKWENNTTDGSWGQAAISTNSGFRKCLRVTTNSTKTPSGSTYAGLLQNIEGYTTNPLYLGTSSAKSFTLSFWVRSTKTGTYSISIKNSNATRVYVTEYSINSASTWEYKTITIAGSTDGSWDTTNGIGLGICWWLAGQGAQTSSTNTWLTSNANMSSNQVNLFDTTSATWDITGVQLEVGSVATEFERRPYPVEKKLCERYYQKHISNTAYHRFTTGVCGSSTAVEIPFRYSVEMRTTPSGTFSGNFRARHATASALSSMAFSAYMNEWGTMITGTMSGGTAGFACNLDSNNDTSAYIALSAEL